MPSQRNIQQLAVLKEKLEKARSIVFADHSGMTMSEFQDLRTQVRTVGGDITVTKNTLLSLALRKKVLGGPTSVLLSYEDEVLPIKILAVFAKTHEKPTMKAGFLGEMPLTAADVLKLAALPGKDELIRMMLARLQGPAWGLVSVLSGNTRRLVYVLNAREERLK